MYIERMNSNIKVYDMNILSEIRANPKVFLNFIFQLSQLLYLVSMILIDI